MQVVLRFLLLAGQPPSIGLRAGTDPRFSCAAGTSSRHVAVGTSHAVAPGGDTYAGTVSCVVVDLEATCCDAGSFPRSEMEIIEIGAVLLDDELRPAREFCRFVRPTLHPQLTEFCTRLTTIQQSDVDSAPLFPEALDEFVRWIGSGQHWLCSWGEYDRRQLQQDCALHGTNMPTWFASRHRNIKKMYADARGCKPCGLGSAINRLGLKFDGTQHRGIDDARNIAAVVRHLRLMAAS